MTGRALAVRAIAAITTLRHQTRAIHNDWRERELAVGVLVAAVRRHAHGTAFVHHAVGLQAHVRRHRAVIVDVTAARNVRELALV